MVLGTQWYILFNVIAGRQRDPTDMRGSGIDVRRGAAGMVGAASSCR